MMIWVDPVGGTHYHRPTCLMMKDARFTYQVVERSVRRLGRPRNREYTSTTVGGRRYYPCPACFGHGRA